MFNKIMLVVLAALLALTGAETSKHGERQAQFPEQFAQLTNKFQEAFVNPSGGVPGGIPQFPMGQIPSLPSPGLPSSRRHLGDFTAGYMY